MTIGLIVLGIVSVLIFFGLLERFFIKMGIKSWLAFLLVLALVIGAIIPDITIGNFLSINIGGFIVPLVIMVMLLAMMKSGAEVFRTLVALVAVAAVAVTARMLIEPLNAGLIMASSLIVGFVGGTAAFLAGQTRLSTLAAAAGGIILGDIITGMLYKFMGGVTTVAFGSYGVFDAVVVASVFGMLLCEAVLAIKRVNASKRVPLVPVAVGAEAAEDVVVKDTAREDSVVLYNENDALSISASKYAETEASKSADAEAAKENLDYAATADNFFDDYI